VLVALFWLVGRALGDHSSRDELILMRHLEQGPTGVFTHIAKGLSTVGSQSVLVPVAVVIAIVLIVRRRMASAAVVAISTIGAITLSNVVKVLVDRPRPASVHLVSVLSSSFPSGHATQAAAILPALGIGVIALGARRWIAMSLAVTGAVAIGLSRVWLGVHYPSDVLAGWALGATWLAVTVAAVHRMKID
jgi:undecaprenyl-diphosphatase